MLKENNSIREDSDQVNDQASDLQGQMDIFVSTNKLDSSDHVILRTLIKTANKNVLRDKHGMRHEDIIKAFAAYVKMIGGTLAYETLHANLPLLWPSLATANRFIYKICLT